MCGQVLGEQEAVVGVDPPGQGPLQRHPLAPHLALGQARQHRGVVRPGHERGQDRPPRDPVMSVAPSPA